LHPRPNKYNHAAVFGLVQRSEIGGKLQLPVCAMVVNFEKGTKDQESLMYHRNVRTFFHEFGHVMH
jgi:Zn-dependent oligopeptidase